MVTLLVSGRAGPHIEELCLRKHDEPRPTQQCFAVGWYQALEGPDHWLHLLYIVFLYVENYMYIFFYVQDIS